MEDSKIVIIDTKYSGEENKHIHLFIYWKKKLPIVQRDSGMSQNSLII